MTKEKYEIAVFGAGFAGSLVAIIARRLGYDVVLIERHTHPRFAIGESSTPLANLKLAQLANDFGLDWLKPLTKYGSWTRSYPEITRGLKRGFSFFEHRKDEVYSDTDQHENSLFVAANPDDERGDTHWYRAEWDEFFAKKAVEEGVRYFDDTNISALEQGGNWKINGVRNEESIAIDADFVVDATGDAAVVARLLGHGSDISHLQTSTRVLYAHFEDVTPWSDVLDESGIDRCGHPFSADASALHHVTKDGWMWVLRFDNGITSAGWSLPFCRDTFDAALDPEDEWSALMDRFPSIGKQFEQSKRISPLLRTGRAQRKLDIAGGDDWVCLPHAAAFVDPWLSPGIAFTLFGVERFAQFLAAGWNEPSRRNRLTQHRNMLAQEVRLLDQMSASCLSRLDAFPIVTSTAMVYFAAAITMEEALQNGVDLPGRAFLLADDPEFCAIVSRVCEKAATVRAADAGEFQRFVAGQIQPYNSVGLCDAAKRNMYPYKTH